MKLIHAPSSTSQPLFLHCTPFSLSFCMLHPPPTPPPPRPLQHSSSPFSNGNGTEPRWSSSARSELSLLRREFMDGHAEFLRFGPARIENFSLWPNHFGHSLSSLPQYTAGLWLLLLCIMEKKNQVVPSIFTTSPFDAWQNPLMVCGDGCLACMLAYWQPSKLWQSELIIFASWATNSSHHRFFHHLSSQSSLTKE